MNKMDLLNELRSVDNFEDNFEDEFESDNAENRAFTRRKPVSNNNSAGKLSRAVNMRLGSGGGQPQFVAQIDLITTIVYTAQAGNAVVLPGALAGAAQTGLPVFFFGNSDYFSGFSAAYKQTPVNTAWSLVGIFVSGVDNLTAAAYTNVLPLLKKGDLLIQYAYGATNFGFVILSCAQVAYLTLLTSISSDRFVINQIRYNVTDTTKVGQYNNNLNIIRQSLFGRISSDFISPVSFRDPSNQQNNIIDIKITKGVDKETVITSYANFDVGTFTLSLFIGTVSKVQAI